MGKPAVLAIKVVADSQQAQAELGKTQGAVKKTGDTLGKMALPATVALGAVTAFGKSAVSAASDVEQAMGGLEAVFGKNAQQAKDLANNAAEATGLATADYAQMATVIGSQLKGMGTAQDDLVPSTNKLIELGADLAATYGGTTADAVSAISSLMRGERDAIEKYGISMNQAAIDAEIMALGLGGATGAAKTQAQAQATLSLLTKQSADAQGGFARETDTAAHQQQVLTAQIQDAKAALGEALLPVVAEVSKALAKMAEFIAENSKVVGILIGIVGGLAAAILIANGVIKAVTLVTKAWSAAQVILNAVLKANPIGLVVTALGLLALGLKYAWDHSETFRRIVTNAFNAVLSVAKSVAAWIQKYLGPVMDIGFKAASRAVETMGRVFERIFDHIKWVINGCLDVIHDIAGAVQRVIDLISRIHLPDLSGLNPFSRSAVPAGAVASSNSRAMAGTRRARGGSTSSAGGITVNVMGALDPDAVARQIRDLLSRADVRNGSRVGVTRGWVAGVTA